MFDTSLLDQALKQKQQQLEQERQQLIQKTNHWLDQWGQQYGITRAYLFGSVTQVGRFRWGSDVDLALETVTPNSIFEIIAQLSATLERDVDVIELSKCHFAEQIRRSGLPWTPNN